MAGNFEPLKEENAMSNNNWNPWKMTAIGMALVIVTALATGLVVANWYGNDKLRPVTSTSRGSVRPVATTPSASDIDVCNQYAKASAGDKTTEVVKDALIGGALGAGVGAAGGAIAGRGGRDVGKGAAVGGVVGATVGTLYGLNEANKNDARSVEAYRACMRGRGYTS
jgi:hypothetical protein